MLSKDEEASRFWKKVDRINDCWLWNGAQNENGYGVVCRGMKILIAHRYAYQISHGEIPKDHDVKRKCKNNLCVNPDHLYLYKYSDEDKLKIFWNSFEKQDNGCWLWTGPTRNMNTSSYGYIYVGGTVRSARDLMWELTYGKVQGWRRIGNTCGDKLCVNPEHLFLRQGRK